MAQPGMASRAAIGCVRWVGIVATGTERRHHRNQPDSRSVAVSTTRYATDDTSAEREPRADTGETAKSDTKSLQLWFWSSHFFYLKKSISGPSKNIYFRFWLHYYCGNVGLDIFHRTRKIFNRHSTPPTKNLFLAAAIEVHGTWGKIFIGTLPPPKKNCL